VEIEGAKYQIAKILTPAQLKHARREFSQRAKGIGAGENITQLFADSLNITR